MRKKVMIFISVLLMLTIISPASFAASTNTIDRVIPLLPNSVLNIGDSGDYPAPILQIEDNHDDFQHGQAMLFYLHLTNSEWTFDNTDNSTDILDVTSWTQHEGLQNSDWEITIVKTNSTTIQIEVTLISNDTQSAQLRIPMLTRIADVGEARVTLDPMNSPVTGGTYTFATVAERPYTVVTVVRIPTLEGEGPQTAGQVIVDETFPDVLVGTNTLLLSLSEGFHWHENTRIRFYSLNITPLDGLEVAEDGYYKLTLINGNNATISFDSEKHFTRGTIVIEPIITDTILSPSREVHLDIESLEGKAETHTDILIATTAANDDEIVFFPDPNFEQAIREKLDKPTGDITKADMATINELFLSFRGIQELTGIEHATNLMSLGTQQNDIDDISALSSLRNLTELALSENNLRDFSPLSSLTNLQRLFLDSDQLNDLTPLSSLTNLTELSISSDHISDLSPLMPLTKLDQLNIGGLFSRNQIEDLTPLANLTNLETLRVSRSLVSDLSPLSSLTNLTQLSLSANQIIDLSPLSSLPNLKGLSLDRNQITHISPLMHLTTLEGLSLDGNLISDLNPLIPLSALKSLNLGLFEGNLIEDITPLANLKGLVELSFNHNQVTDISAVSHLTNLRGLLLEYNNVYDVTPIKNLLNLQSLVLSNNKIENISPLVDNHMNNGISVGGSLILRNNPLDLDNPETLADLQLLINSGIILQYTTSPGMLPLLPDAPGSSDLAFMKLVIDGETWHYYTHWWGVDSSTKLITTDVLFSGLQTIMDDRLFMSESMVPSYQLSYEYGETKITMELGSRTAYINNSPVQMDAEPISLFGRTLVPAQFVIDQFGMTGRVSIELIQTHQIDLSAEPAAGGTLTGRGNYEQGSQISVSATPNSDHRFEYWKENETVSNQATYSFPATANRSLTAVFSPLSVPDDEETPPTIPPTGGGGGGGGGAPGTAKIQVATSRDNTITRDEFTVIIPAQSLSMETFVIIRPLSDSQFLIPEGSQLASPIFDISLEDQDVTILKPITLKFNFDPELVPEGLMPSLFWYNAKSEEWHELEEIVVDWEKNTVTGQIDHLTPFAVLTVENPDYIAVEEIHEDIIQNQAVFIIGRKGYQIDGVWHEADVAPYIQPTPDGFGRTMMPVRYVSIALGADEVLWDAGQRLVTVKKGASVIQLTIGETILWRDNERIEMDVPAIVQTVSDAGGRTMIPVAHLAKALDVTYHWNDQDRSVTFELETIQEED